MSDPVPTKRVRLKARPSAAHTDFSWWALTWFVGAHLIVLAFLVPYFSWQAYLVTITLHLFLGLSVTLIAHRYFSHSTFKAPTWLENLMAVLYTLSYDRCGEGIISWVAGHRFHHAYPDQELDPHSPVVRGYWHAYCGHFIWRRRDLYDFNEYKHYCPNLSRKPFIVWLDKKSTIIGLQIALIVSVYAAGGLIGPAEGFDTWMATSFLVWGVFGRYCYSQFSHSMVDTISHGVSIFKRLPDTCNTGTSAKNNMAYWWCTLGNETWHNIHHAFPRAANNGEKWYRWDIDSVLMWSMQKFGLVSGCKYITEADIARRMNSDKKMAF